MKIICENCGCEYERSYNRKRDRNRRRFCSQLCYRLFNAKHKKDRDHHNLYNDFKRFVWGSTGLEQGGIDKIKQFDYKRYEAIARDKLLSKLGFTDIIDMNELLLGFSFDFIAIKNGRKVAIDITTKFKANARIKKRLADALSIDLYVLFMSPEHDDMFYLQKLTTTTFNIPQQFFKDEAEKRGIDISEYFMIRP